MKIINESFVCLHCHKLVPQARGTCRNHCPYCRVSQHVDGDIPGDRSTHCHGLMYPTMYEIANGMSKVSFTCITCGKVHRNKTLPDDDMMVLDEKIITYKAILERKYVEQMKDMPVKAKKRKGRTIRK